MINKFSKQISNDDNNLTKQKYKILQIYNSFRSSNLSCKFLNRNFLLIASKFAVHSKIFSVRKNTNKHNDAEMVMGIRTRFGQGDLSCGICCESLSLWHHIKRVQYEIASKC